MGSVINNEKIGAVKKADEGPEHIIPIVFATNDGYAPYAGVAIESIIANASPRNDYRIYVLHTSISGKHVEMLESLTTDIAVVQCVNVGEMIREIQTPLPLIGHITQEAYYRILIPEIEALKDFPYIVYLDSDIIVDSDIADIIPNGMGDNLIAAVRDYPMQRTEDRERLKRDYDLNAEQYVNSGVLVINSFQWRQEETSKRCFEFLRDAASKKYVYMDQDIINLVCKNRILYLDESWNYNWFFCFGDKETVALCKPFTDRIGGNFHVLHYTTALKPWYTLEHPFSHYFWKYAGKSLFFEEILKTNLCGKAEFEDRKEELEAVYHSVSFRIGRAITWLPRKVRGGVRRLRELGHALMGG